MQTPISHRVEIIFYVPSNPTLASYLIEHEFETSGETCAYFSDTLYFKALKRDFDDINEDKSHEHNQQRTHDNLLYLEREVMHRKTNKFKKTTTRSSTIMNEAPNIICFSPVESKSQIKNDPSQMVV